MKNKSKARAQTIKSGAIASLFFMLTSSCSLLGISAHHCDPEKEISFLAFGPEIVGRWVEVWPDRDTGDVLEFDEAGKLIHESFGCWHNLFPLVEGEYNTGSGFGGQQFHLDTFDISPGYFKLSGSYTFEGRLQENGTLRIKSSPQKARSILWPGNYVKETMLESQAKEDRSGFIENRSSRSAS